MKVDVSTSGRYIRTSRTTSRSTRAQFAQQLLEAFRSGIDGQWRGVARFFEARGQLIQRRGRGRGGRQRAESEQGKNAHLSSHELLHLSLTVRCRETFVVRKKLR